MPEVVNTSSLQSLLVQNFDDAHKPTAIAVDDVSMVFNMASQQLNSLKEYFLAAVKHELMFKEFRALRHITLDVKKGDVFGIMGTNGSGKSTLLKIIAGVLEPSEGHVTINGNIAPLIELGAGFDMELTARENIYLNGALLGYRKEFIDENFDAIVDFAEVSGFLDMPMKNFSSGMVARVAFAVATVIVPDILIVDEVLSVGDFMFQQKCEQRIQSLIKDHQVTVLLVSHSNEQVQRLCNKAVWIEKGHMRAIGSAKDVCQLYRALGGRAGDAASEEAILAALQAEVAVPEGFGPCYFGESQYDTAAQLSSVVPGLNREALVVTRDDVTALTRIASCFAGAAELPLLTTRANQLAIPAMQEIRITQPATIYVVGSEAEVNEAIFEVVQTPSYKPRVVRLEGADVQAGATGGVRGLEALRCGASFWGSSALVAIAAEGTALQLLIPWAARVKAPVLVLDETFAQEGLAAALAGFSQVVFAGPATEAAMQLQEQLRAAGCTVTHFADGALAQTNDQVNAWICSQLAAAGEDEPATVVVSAPSNTLDNNIVGLFAARNHAVLLFEDTKDLDSIAHAIVSVRAAAPEQLIFMGSHIRFNDFDKSLLCKAACMGA